MRRAIIDNATLTAVQRLMGKIPVYNKYTLDGDILAYETLIQTLLFFDEIYYIDDYKEKYQSDRANFFNYLDGITIEKSDYERLLEQTRNLSKDIIPVIEGGTFNDDNFKPFFDLLKMNNVFTWDMSSSIYYLTQKMLNGAGNELDIKEYSKIVQMIFNENQDNFEKEIKPKGIIIDSRGKKISSSGYTVVDKEGQSQEAYIGRQTELLLANLSWLAYRTIFYTITANQLGGSLILHPIRDAFQISYLNKINVDFNNTYNRLISAMNKPAEDMIKAIFEPTQPLVAKYTLPLFSIAITDRTGDPLETINAVLNMREEGNFVEARRKLSEVEQLFEEGKNAKARIEANKLINDVGILLEQLGEKYYVHTPQGISLSPLIQAYNIGTAIPGSIIPQIPDFAPKIKVLNRVKELIPQHGFNAVYKSLVNDLLI